MDIEQEAKMQGWVPKEEFHGDEAKWVPAEEYVERGKHIMPILQSNNKRLLSELDSVKSEMQKLQATITSQSESMEELKAFHQESTKAQVEKARRDLMAELREAKRDGDIDQEIKLTADLSKFDAAQQQVKQESRQSPQHQPQQLDPVTVQWMKENPWYGTDLERTGLMDGVAKKMRKEDSPLFGRAFLEAAAQVVAEKFEAVRTPVSKVDGGGSVDTGKPSGPATYAKMPAEARAQCDAQASKFVGDNKVYKTKKEWQEFYATEYFKAYEGGR